MKEWKRNGYIIREERRNRELYYYNIVIDGEIVDSITVKDKETFSYIRDYFDSGEEVIGMEDGRGSRIWLPLYVIAETDKNDKWADNIDIFESYSKLETENKFNSYEISDNKRLLMGNYDKENEFNKMDERNSN